MFLPILIIILVGAVGYFAYQNYQTKQDIPHVETETMSTPSPKSDTSVKKRFNFVLAEYEGYTYKLSWEGHEIDANEDYDTGSDSEWIKNIRTPVSLVRSKVEEVDDSNFEVLELSIADGKGQLQLMSGSPDPDSDRIFLILAQPENSSKVIFTQGMEGTGGLVFWLIDVKTGKLDSLTRRFESYGDYCRGVPFQKTNVNQKYYIFSCEVAGTDTEMLYKYNIITEEVEQIVQTKDGWTFECVSEYGNIFSYEYVNDKRTNEVVLILRSCDISNLEITDPITISME